MALGLIGFIGFRVFRGLRLLLHEGSWELINCGLYVCIYVFVYLCLRR